MPLKQRGKFPNVVKEASEFKRRVVTVLANEAKNHFLEGFRKGGFQTDASRQGWKKRKDEDGSRAILVKTGQLRRSIDVRRATFDRIVIGTLDVPYAEYHNTGIAGRLPQREFLGKSAALQKVLRKLLIRELNRAFK